MWKGGFPVDADAAVDVEGHPEWHGRLRGKTYWDYSLRRSGMRHQGVMSDGEVVEFVALGLVGYSQT